VYPIFHGNSPVSQAPGVRLVVVSSDSHRQGPGAVKSG
jgi:hypothetical protein